MTILEVQKKYNTQAKCLKLLEKLRWGKIVKCAYCVSDKTKPIKSEPGRHTCKNCNRSFSVFVDTIFEDTRQELPKWFTAIVLMLNAKSGIAAKEIQRNIGGSYKTSYYMAMRIRIGMLMKDTKLNGIIEMDESYFGSKARKRRKSADNTADLATTTLKRGRGTNKVSVAGMVQRKGNVKTKVIEKLTKRSPLGKIIPFKKVFYEGRNNNKKREYRASKKVCIGCPLRGQCLGKTVQEKRITITFYRAEYQRNNARVNSKKGRYLKTKRQSTVEPVLGVLKEFTGLRKVKTIGIKQANKCMHLAATAYNLKKYLKFTNKTPISMAGIVDQAKKGLKSAFLAVKWPLWGKTGRFQAQYKLVMLKIR